MKNMTISVRDIHNQSDLTVFYLSFFKSLNFDINKDMAINHGCLDNFISIINVNPERKILFDDIILKYSSINQYNKHEIYDILMCFSGDCLLSDYDKKIKILNFL